MSKSIFTSGGPSNAMPRKAWSVWGKILAYLLLLAVASVSIWFIDRLAMREMQNLPVSPSGGVQSSN